MKVYLFGDRGALVKAGFTRSELTGTFEELALDTDTTDLVAAVYLFRRQSVWEAHSVGETIGPEKFTDVRGYWRFVKEYDVPDDLPDRFYLIRIALGLRRRYPATETDIYDWEMAFETFKDHLAYTFAHELHHFRRDHLHEHPREGELAATKWGIALAQKAGYNVSGIRLPVKRRRKAAKKRTLRLPLDSRPQVLRRVKLMASHLSKDNLRDLNRWIRNRLLSVNRQTRSAKLQERFDRLRVLGEGTPLFVCRDEDGHGYLGQVAAKVRNLRRDSSRMLIRTPDGEEWNWPMEWLETLDANGEKPAPRKRKTGAAPPQEETEPT